MDAQVTQALAAIDQSKSNLNYFKNKIQSICAKLSKMKAKFGMDDIMSAVYFFLIFNFSSFSLLMGLVGSMFTSIGLLGTFIEFYRSESAM